MAIQAIPSPVNFTQVSSFLGLAGYYRRFINDFTGKAAVLYAVTSKRKSFSWGDTKEESFLSLKNALTSPTDLALAGFGKPFIVDTGASFSAVGAVLSQKQPDGKLHPIQYASRTMNSEEKRNFACGREALRVVF